MTNYILVSKKTREPLHVGDKLQTFHGVSVVLLGSEEPRNENSSGRVIVEFYNGNVNEFYPDVVNAEFIYAM